MTQQYDNWFTDADELGTETGLGDRDSGEVGRALQLVAEFAKVARRPPGHTWSARRLPRGGATLDRRAYATSLARVRVNDQTAMALTGHSDPKVHQRYVELASIRTRPVAAVPTPRVWRCWSRTSFGPN